MTNNMTRAEMTSVDSWLACAWQAKAKAIQTLRSYCEPRRNWRGEERWAQINEHYDWPRIDEAVETVKRANAVIAVCDDIWAANGYWSRYYLVLNSNGHVHRERSCTTCFPTTEYSWLINLAGADEAEMVREFGSDACTVCFPSAPTLPGWGSSKSKREKEEAKAARLAAREAKKAADRARNELENPVEIPDDGYANGRTKVIRRLADARHELKSAFAWNKSEERFPLAIRHQLAVEIAKKTGKTADQVLTATIKAAAKGY